MINRSALKYSLKKILPKPLFEVLLFFWQKIAIRVIEIIDGQRLKSFKNEKLVTLTHRGNKFKLFISPQNGFIDNHIYLYGVYEPFMLDLIKKYLHTGMTYVDIGANIGQHSIFAATLLRNTGAVYAYEPIPEIYKQLARSTEANSLTNIVSRNYALGEKESTELLHVSKNIGGSSLVNNDETKETIKIQVKKGDDELLEIPRIDLIKIDVEGYELEVLTGIRDTLKKHAPVILLEFSGNFYKIKTNGNGIRILELLTECDYRLYDIEDRMSEVIDTLTFNAEISGKRKQTNLLCLPKNHTNEI